MTSGKIAGEVAAQAITSGDVSDHGMSLYESRLRDSFVIKDLYKYRKTGSFFEKNPHLLKVYPEIACKAMRMYFTVDETPKKEVQKQIIKMVFEKRSKSGLFRDLFNAWRAFK